jgi:hypothetical protein
MNTVQPFGLCISRWWCGHCSAFLIVPRFPLVGLCPNGFALKARHGPELSIMALVNDSNLGAATPTDVMPA